MKKNMEKLFQLNLLIMGLRLMIMNKFFSKINRNKIKNLNNSNKYKNRDNNCNKPNKNKKNRIKKLMMMIIKI